LAEASGVGRRAIAVFCLGLAAACEGTDGDRIDLVTRYAAADGAFSVDYVAPPWRVELEDPAALELRIDAEVFGYGIDGLPPTHVFRIERVAGAEALDELFEGFGERFAGEIDRLTLEDLDADALDTDTDGSDTDESDTEAFPDDLGEIPDYLFDLDLRSPRDVALAEMRMLVHEQSAHIDEPLQFFRAHDGREGVVFQAILREGVFLRSYYFRSSGNAVRAMFVSLFDLRTDDIDRMAKTIATDAAVGARP